MSGVEAWFHAYDGQPDHPFFWNHVPGESDGFDGVDVAYAAEDGHADLLRERIDGATGG